MKDDLTKLAETNLVSHCIFSFLTIQSQLVGKHLAEVQRIPEEPTKPKREEPPQELPPPKKQKRATNDSVNAAKERYLERKQFLNI